MSRQYTDEEVRGIFLTQVKAMVEYWNTTGLPNMTCKERLDGLAFSIMVILDGESALPAFIVAPYPHKDDREFNISQDENWFPENNREDINCDIAGQLHEMFCKEKE